MTTPVEQIEELGERVAQAQLHGDPCALDALLADGFKIVGPAGFVLDKQQWIQQYSSGRLVVRSLEWDDVDVRVYGDVAVTIGRQRHQVAFQGQPSGGAFRVTQVAIRTNGEWRLLGMHLSAITPPPAAAA